MDIAPDYPNIIDRIKAYNTIAGLGYDCWQDDLGFVHAENESGGWQFANFKEAVERLKEYEEYKHLKEIK